MSTPIPDIVLLFDTLSMYSLGWKNNTAFNTIQSYDSILGSFKVQNSLQHHTTGTFEYSHMMYIPVGKTGYLIFKQGNVPGANRLWS